MTYGQVRELRSKMKLTQKEFATILGVSIGTIRAKEQGLTKVGGSLLRSLNLMKDHPAVIAYFKYS